MPKPTVPDALASHIHARSLRYFDAIRRYGSIREAARQLHVASSAVNRQLLKLEAEVGTPLFERLAGGLSLTAAGEVFARHVITVLQDARRFESEMDALRGIRRGEIGIVTVEGLNSSFLPNLIERMLTRYPAIQFRVRTAGSASIPRTILDGDADLGLAFSLPQTGGLQQLAVGRFQLGAIVAVDHPLAGETAVTFAQCARYPLILGNAQLSISGLLAPLIRRYGKPLQLVLESDSIELMRRMAARGHGVGFQTRLGLERDLADRTLVHIPLRAPRALVSELGAYARAGRTLTPALDAFVRLLAEAIAEREDDEPDV
ncbi:LysR family transcriptional regulator [Paraburkholderia caballeronis]|uniref:DNA-binding transcriptional regulator, LysR family n=1 Tax=Paraburkholderia caballeronis TaxID=416943 RepID=A0A1H7RQS0_9BURK|nr:LysR family transcriptional regulator [Paraburkholderia caballeronis]PXW23163.1 DNA-binding transcriptional LysR family regulator [Paraburkholderia caballeronis]PXW97827.1 DNA-binding transcriptional LysR family regulator [Paraburkholderia caballeronis]RAJ94797.1 DNA-binding transcriptional LysR family regulator [Paraburkholderia caballeronis]TDV27282.1 DNA-binding transcriptional LysR family regulator [Paraburkholderia caballeronis]SEE62287.1 DNA-binding transcriptional regulator, LysR fam